MNQEKDLVPREVEVVMAVEMVIQIEDLIPTGEVMVDIDKNLSMPPKGDIGSSVICKSLME